MKKILFTLFGLLLVFSAHAGFEGLNDDVSLDIFNRINCGQRVECTRKGNGVFNIAESGVQNQITITTSTGALSTQCGSTFVSSAVAVISLPEASGLLGCQYTFINGSTPVANFDINPDDLNEIQLFANAVGDAIRQVSPGGAITLEAVLPLLGPTSTGAWAPIGLSGTWSDVN